MTMRENMAMKDKINLLKYCYIRTINIKRMKEIFYAKSSHKKERVAIIKRSKKSH